MSDEYVIHLFDSINIPSDYHCGGIPIGDEYWRRSTDGYTVVIGQCEECNLCVTSFVRRCAHHGRRHNITPDMYKGICTAAEMVGLHIEGRDHLDRIYLPFVLPEDLFSIQDEEGNYIYVVSKDIDIKGENIQIIRVGSCISIQSFTWNMETIDGLSLDMFIRVKDAPKILQKISHEYSSQDRWIRGHKVSSIAQYITPLNKE